MKLIIASGNAGKLREIRAILGGKFDEIVSMKEAGIDHETVDDNARQLGTAPREELLRVVIHGIMHLCGYKDKSDEEAAQMRQKEDFYLQRFPQ